MTLDTPTIPAKRPPTSAEKPEKKRSKKKETKPKGPKPKRKYCCQHVMIEILTFVCSTS